MACTWSVYLTNPSITRWTFRKVGGNGSDLFLITSGNWSSKGNVLWFSFARSDTALSSFVGANNTCLRSRIVSALCPTGKPAWINVVWSCPWSYENELWDNSDADGKGLCLPRLPSAGRWTASLAWQSQIWYRSCRSSGLLDYLPGEDPSWARDYQSYRYNSAQRHYYYFQQKEYSK